jgi:hypothetical protein
VAQPIHRVLRSQLGNEDAVLICSPTAKSRSGCGVALLAMVMDVAQPIPRVLRSQLGNEYAILILQYPTAKSSYGFSVALPAMN